MKELNNYPYYNFSKNDYMRVLFFTLSPNGYYKSLISQFIKQNHQVIVVSPDFTTRESYLQNVSENYDILFFRAKPLSNVSTIKKGIADFVFPFYCKYAIRKYISHYLPDLIISSTPPLGFLSSIKYFKKKNKYCKYYLILRDIWPEAFKLFSFDKRFPLFYKYYRLKEALLYDIADVIGCMTQANIDYVSISNPEVSKTKLKLLPNWGDINVKAKKLDDSSIRDKYNWKDKVIFIYGGNIGVPQGLDNIISLAFRMREFKDVIFLIIGKGQDANRIKNVIKKNSLDNVVFFDFLPKEKYEEILGISDVGIISLNPLLKTPSIPSKTLSYWNLKKPIFAIVDSATDYGKNVIDVSNSGVWALANDYDKIDENFKMIVKNENYRKQLGLNGFNYFINNCTTFHIYNLIIRHLYE